MNSCKAERFVEEYEETAGRIQEQLLLSFFHPTLFNNLATIGLGWSPTIELFGFLKLEAC